MRDQLFSELHYDEAKCLENALKLHLAKLYDMAAHALNEGQDKMHGEVTDCISTADTLLMNVRNRIRDIGADT